MKSMKDFLESRQPLPEVVEEEVITIEELEAMDLPDYDIMNETKLTTNHKQEDPPNILIMRRKSIRQFPNKQRVAMYYVDKINKYVTVPYTAMQWSAMAPEEVEHNDEVITEDIIKKLQSITEDSVPKFVNFENGEFVKVNESTANSILKLYKSLNSENKYKIEEMMFESKEQFLKIIDFAYKNLKNRIKNG